MSIVLSFKNRKEVARQRIKRFQFGNEYQRVDGKSMRSPVVQAKGQSEITGVIKNDQNGKKPSEVAEDIVQTRREQDREQAKQSELFFGLVGATGTDLGTVEVRLSDALREAGYVPVKIRLSALIEEHFRIAPPDEEFERIKMAMDQGNELRKLGNESVALLGVLEVRRQRELHWVSNSAKLPAGTEPSDYPKIPLAKRAYIFRSLKHPHEIEMLRQIYGDSFYLISVYSTRARRKSILEKRIAESESGRKWDRRNKKADLLMTRDYIEADLPYGQNVRDSFPLADLFVNVDDPEYGKSLQRFVRLIFGDMQQTPTIDEYSMFHATGAALRSGDLGRQVGAVIASSSGDVISHGTNEAPKAYGGQFWTGDNPDGRGVSQRADISDIRKQTTLIDLLQRLVDNKRITGIDVQGIKELADEIFSDRRPRWMKGADILELIGFYRSVHAETAAIINAARLGVSVRGCNLYVTAFPCHECARHILAAGIEKVFYVEPYPKSLAGKHYPDSIVIDQAPTATHIAFQQFVGIAPRVYMKFFETLERKNKDGTAIKWRSENCCVRYYHHWLAYTTKEAAFVSDFEELISKRSATRRDSNDGPTEATPAGSADSSEGRGQKLASMETAVSEES